MGSRCTQAPYLNGSPAQLRSTNKSKLCGRCEESGHSPHDVSMLDRLRIEPAPAGEELKARTFKDGLTAQLYLRRGVFWDAIRELRERREITVKRSLPPAGDNISALIIPGPVSEDEDLFAVYRSWISDLHQIEQRCVPARFRGSAEWREFIAACVLFDPPRAEDLDMFTRHGDPVLLNRDSPSARRERAPMKAMAPVVFAIADEKEFEKAHLWLLERLLEEIGERYLGPAGINLDEALNDIFDSTELNN
jgi:hypothetical protein